MKKISKRSCYFKMTYPWM